MGSGKAGERTAMDGEAIKAEIRAYYKTMPWMREYIKPVIEIVDRHIRKGHWLAHQEDRWIYAECSECHTVHDVKTKYCPECGARMEEQA